MCLFRYQYKIVATCCSSMHDKPSNGTIINRKVILPTDFVFYFWICTEYISNSSERLRGPSGEQDIRFSWTLTLSSPALRRFSYEQIFADVCNERRSSDGISCYRSVGYGIVEDFVLAIIFIAFLLYRYRVKMLRLLKVLSIANLSQLFLTRTMKKHRWKKYSSVLSHIRLAFHFIFKIGEANGVCNFKSHATLWIDPLRHPDPCWILFGEALFLSRIISMWCCDFFWCIYF